MALFDYDPTTMSPNPDGCEEELPFQEGDQIKVVNTLIRLTKLSRAFVVADAFFVCLLRVVFMCACLMISISIVTLSLYAIGMFLFVNLLVMCAFCFM